MMQYSTHSHNSDAVDNQQQAAVENDPQLLKVYVYYRTLLSSILLLMFQNDMANHVLGVSNPQLFAYTAFSYTATNLLILLVLWKGSFVPRTEQIVAILLTDILAITLLSHFSNGMDGNITFLLLICVAAGSIFLRAPAAMALAGLTALLVLSESVYSNYMGYGDERAIFSSGVFGVLLFATTFVFNNLSAKIRQSTEEALAQAEHAAYLQRLSQLIIERMHTGIIVANKDDEAILINRAAGALVGVPYNHNPGSIQLDAINALRHELTTWRNDPQARPAYLKIRADGPEIRVSFAQLEPRPGADTLIFVEDNGLLAQEAQQLKLASLGRLTASIAHEIRNPLGAISHAAQLLAESDSATAADKRLGEIIHSHSRRVNHIIENVLQLSRRQAAAAETLDLKDWLNNFVQEYRQIRQADIKLEVIHPEVRTRADSSQLHQVLSNLCDNGLRYSFANTGRASLTLVAGIDPDTELAYIEVIDDGVGIADDDIQQVFEPFFTTESTGSGLGLYISRELCEANQATLSYKRTDEDKSCFRINLAHPDRVF